MAEMNDIVKLAVDAYRGNVEKYSTNQSMDTLRQALVDLNGGSTMLDYKKIRDGECKGLFTIVETILSRVVVEGLQSSDFFNSLVEFRNVAEGDKNLFIIEDDNLFVVSEIAAGTQALRRQRLGGSSEVSIPTMRKGVKIYEELNRVLSGRVDFNYFINKVAASFSNQLLEDINAAWMGATAEQLGGVTYFPAAGAYDEDELMELIAHVEAAASGKPATIVGTRKALRNLKPAMDSDAYKNDMFNQGYVGKFYGTPVVCLPQRHKIGSTEFTMSDDFLTFIAGDQKPIKCVREGNPMVLMGDPMQNQDLTQTYLYTESYGIAIVLAGGNSGIGRYEIA